MYEKKFSKENALALIFLDFKKSHIKKCQKVLIESVKNVKNTRNHLK